MTAVERVMERMEREFERRRGKATEGHAPVGTGNMRRRRRPCHRCRPRSCVPPPSVDRAGTLRDASRRDFSDATHAGIDARARGRVGRRRRRRDGMGWTPATQATPGAGWAGWGATQQFRDPISERAELKPTEPTPTEPKPTEPKPTPPPSLEEALDASGGTQPEPEEPEPALICEPARCRSCGAEVAPSLASLERRPAGNLTYLATLAEANGDARVSDVDRVALVVPALVAARRLCAAPAPIRPRTDAGDVPPPNWAGDCQGVWVPEDGCYYAPSDVAGDGSVFASKLRTTPGEISRGARYCWRHPLREGEPTPRVETTKTRKRTDVDDDEGGAPEREERASRRRPPPGDQPAEEPARKRRRIRRKASAEAAVGRREANDALLQAGRAGKTALAGSGGRGGSLHRVKNCRASRLLSASSIPAGPQAQALPRGVRRRRRGGSGSARVAVVPHAGARRMRRSFAARWIRIESNGIVHRSSRVARRSRLPPLSREFSSSRVFSHELHHPVNPPIHHARHREAPADYRAHPGEEMPQARRCVAHLHHDGAQIVQKICRRDATVGPASRGLEKLSHRVKVRVDHPARSFPGFWFSARSSRPARSTAPGPGAPPQRRAQTRRRRGAFASCTAWGRSA